MAIDDSFKKPGAIPFKWEVRPGVPKTEGQQLRQQQQKQQKKLSPPKLSSPSKSFVHYRPCPSPTTTPKQKLKPPPGGYIFIPPQEPRSHSFRSMPHTRSERWRFEQPARVRQECVSPGCFPSPLLRKKESKRRSSNKIVTESALDYTSDLDPFSRWSFSSRMSPSPFRESPMSSFSSYQSSPRLVSDAEWAGFGLF